MRRLTLTPAAKQDRRDEVRYYRQEAGTKIATKLVEELQRTLHELERNPGIGSPVIGQRLGIDGLRAWRVSHFPLSLWYFDRGDQVLIVRIVGQRQDAGAVDVPN